MLDQIDWTNVDADGFVVGHRTRRGFRFKLEKITKDTYFLGVEVGSHVASYVYTPNGYWKREIPVDICRKYNLISDSSRDWNKITQEMLMELRDFDSKYDIIVNIDFY